MEFSRNLRNARLSRNLTQSHVAKQLGISVSTYTKYETGTNEPDLNMLVRLSDFYHVSVDFLLRGSTNENEEKSDDEMVLSDTENMLIDQFRRLGELDKGRMLERLAVLLEMSKKTG